MCMWLGGGQAYIGLRVGVVVAVFVDGRGAVARLGLLALCESVFYFFRIRIIDIVGETHMK